MGVVWQSRRTRRNRYRGRITEAVTDYAGRTGKKSLKILDVGCSTGVAIRSMAEDLKGSGIATRIEGVEVSKKAWKKAEKNLDRLIHGDVREIEPEPDFDVVLCFKMILFQTPEIRQEVLSACAKWIKQDGLLATDAHERYIIVKWRGVLRTVLGREVALKYPRIIQDGWDSMGRLHRCRFRCFAGYMKILTFILRR